MATITIGTFNCENLFTRFKFRGKRIKKTVDGKTTYEYRPYTPEELEAATKNGFLIDKDKFERVIPDERLLTAKAIKGIGADLVGLQEVENLDTLKTFCRNTRHFSAKARYPFMYLMDGNDPRLIDVAAISKLPIIAVRTHQYVRSGNTYLFSRDCLEVEVMVGTKVLTVFVNHFKSMMDGRAKTRQRRLNQCEGQLKILRDKFGSGFGDADWVIVGDLNDYMEDGLEGESGLRPLLTSGDMENVLNRLPADERWTHWWDRERSFHQLDYILLSRSLAQRNPTVKPVVERRGLTRKVNRPGEPERVKTFFPEVEAGTSASDHCPMAIKIKV